MTTIHQALAAVSADIGAVEKGRHSEHGNFMFRGIDDLMNSLHPILANHGVNILPSYERIERYDRTTRNGGINEVVVLRGRFTFSGPEGDTVEVTTIGQASDVSDKATNKAMSAAMKYALIQTFTIPTHDMEDADATVIENAQPLPPVDVTAALEFVEGATEAGLTRTLDALPAMLNAGRISAEDAVRIESAVEARRDVLANQADMDAEAVNG